MKNAPILTKHSDYKTLKYQDGNDWKEIRLFKNIKDLEIGDGIIDRHIRGVFVEKDYPYLEFRIPVYNREILPPTSDKIYQKNWFRMKRKKESDKPDPEFAIWIRTQ